MNDTTQKENAALLVGYAEMLNEADEMNDLQATLDECFKALSTGATWQAKSIEEQNKAFDNYASIKNLLGYAKACEPVREQVTA